MFDRIFDWYLDATTQHFENNGDEAGLKLVKEAIERKLKILEKNKNDAITKSIIEIAVNMANRRY